MLSWQVRKRKLEAEDGSPQEVVKRTPPERLQSRAPNAARGPVSRALRVRESALFRPVRAIGVVTDELPLSPVTLGNDDFVVASVRRGFQVFECKHLRLAYIGPRLNEKIRALLAVGEVVIVALKNDIVAFHRVVELGRFRGHTAPATVLCTIGTGYLVSAAGSEVFVWQLSSVGLQPKESEETKPGGGCVLAPLGALALEPGFGECTGICHPPTYLHKVLLSSSSGELELWNARTLQRVHKFTSHLADVKDRCSITCICEVPNVLDLIGIGFASGRICVLNAREDKVMIELLQTQGRVTSLTFRSGPGAPAHLVTGAPNGTFVVWDLHKRRAHHVAERAHYGPISSVHFLGEQPLLITGGRDNAVRMWIFDTADGLPRPLRSRCGCPGVARRMSFYGERDRELLVGGALGSAGFLARVSFIQDHQNNDYSQAAFHKMTTRALAGVPSSNTRLPPVVDIAYCSVRHYDWPAVVTAHERCSSAFIWSAMHQALAPKVLKPPGDGEVPVSAVAVSACGNYVVLGLDNGLLHRFNLQSAVHRGTIPLPPMPGIEEGPKARAKAAALPPPRAHRGRVCGVEITVGGQVVSLAAHAKDCCLRIWNLMTHAAVTSVPLADGRPGSPSGLLLRPYGSLMAVALDDGALLVVDMNGGGVVRSFDCGVPATDAAFSSDGRWLAAALRDGGLRVFDLLAARCVDSFMFARPALGICFAPSTAFLLTSHTKGNAIQVWANKFLFDPSLSAPLLRPEPKVPVRVDEPGGPEDEEEAPEETLGDEVAEKPQEPVAPSIEPLEPDLLTLSDVPPAKWLATLHLDLVKERNKAIEPPKPLPNAPFFLPTAHDGVTPRFAAPLDGAGGEDRPPLTAEPSRVLRGERSAGKGAALQNMLRNGKFDDALAFLRLQTPSGVHLCIEELGPLAGGDMDELSAGLAFFAHHLAKAHYADEVQAFLSIFLQAHGEELASEPPLRQQCEKLCQVLEGRWTALNTQCQKVRCFLGMLTHTQSQW